MPKNVPLITSMLSTHMHKEYAKKPKATDKLIAEILSHPSVTFTHRTLT